MHGFEGDTPEYLPRGDRKALGSYIVCHPMPKGGCIMQHALFFLLVYESDSHGRLFGTIHNCHEKITLFFFFILTCFRTKLLQFNS